MGETLLSPLVSSWKQGFRLHALTVTFRIELLNGQGKGCSYSGYFQKKPVSWPAWLHWLSGISQAIRFAPLPLEDSRIMHEQFHGLVQYLNRESQQRIEMVFYTDYGENLHRFKHNKQVSL
ncbi:MAG: hypothetical protein KZQ89_11390 [Candidatus Thiodiazotropha sp. (ex Lucinoma kastoroae)]|nr:hypothetical protein [Candidatus Thiodiazotropha sp. (ex Lucinoma kastoroae)]MCU7859936.1 hypothetical protein [Candidatus Thiodiazotropha sp. (ex Lucinoma kastoroae)]